MMPGHRSERKIQNIELSFSLIAEVKRTRPRTGDQRGCVRFPVSGRAKPDLSKGFPLRIGADKERSPCETFLYAFRLAAKIIIEVLTDRQMREI